ncbi:hypothetical protein QJS66_17070 [Kocuria rhizophila]|nr:hypothetical protein QJS66_17070 [Kocuria rhizophila]
MQVTGTAGEYRASRSLLGKRERQEGNSLKRRHPSSRSPPTGLHHLLPENRSRRADQPGELPGGGHLRCGSLRELGLSAGSALPAQPPTSPCPAPRSGGAGRAQRRHLGYLDDGTNGFAASPSRRRAPSRTWIPRTPWKRATARDHRSRDRGRRHALLAVPAHVQITRGTEPARFTTASDKTPRVGGQIRGPRSTC